MERRSPSRHGRSLAVADLARHPTPGRTVGVPHEDHLGEVENLKSKSQPLRVVAELIAKVLSLSSRTLEFQLRNNGCRRNHDLSAFMWYNLGIDTRTIVQAPLSPIKSHPYHAVRSRRPPPQTLNAASLMPPPTPSKTSPPSPPSTSAPPPHQPDDSPPESTRSPHSRCFPHKPPSTSSTTLPHRPPWAPTHPRPTAKPTPASSTPPKSS